MEANNNESTIRAKKLYHVTVTSENSDFIFRDFYVIAVDFLDAQNQVMVNCQKYYNVDVEVIAMDLMAKEGVSSENKTTSGMFVPSHMF